MGFIFLIFLSARSWSFGTRAEQPLLGASSLRLRREGVRYCDLASMCLLSLSWVEAQNYWLMRANPWQGDYWMLTLAVAPAVRHGQNYGGQWKPCVGFDYGLIEYGALLDVHWSYSALCSWKALTETQPRRAAIQSGNSPWQLKREEHLPHSLGNLTMSLS